MACTEAPGLRPTGTPAGHRLIPGQKWPLGWKSQHLSIADIRRFRQALRMAASRESCTSIPISVLSKVIHSRHTYSDFRNAYLTRSKKRHVAVLN